MLQFDQEKILTTSQTQNAVTVLDSNQKQLQQPKNTQFQDVQVQQTENNADFADVNLRTSPLIGQTQQNSQPKLK
ncbi:hypothetical protein, partial [Mycoplasma sp. 'Moose RK']|uniref:hypothetical protein n=1 Tax=Mycoplasma sp. 'Moose RK' TaxID=2780095 RepID=UPI0018C2736E